MKKVCFLIILLCISFVSSQTLPNYYDKYVNDFAKILSENQTSYLRAMFSEIDQNTSAEIVFVSVNSTLPDTPQEYRTKLFNYWHIGKADKNNGLLILYSYSQNRIEVETGYGMEGILPDSKLGRLLDDYYVPERDKGKPINGIILFSEQVSKVIEENRDEVLSGNAGEKFLWSDYLIMGFIILFVISIFSIVIGSFVYNWKKRKENLEKAKIKESSENISKIPEIKLTGRKILSFMSKISFFVFFVLAMILSSYGIKMFVIIIFIVGGFCLPILLNFLTRNKCPNCGNLLKYKRHVGEYDILKCSNNHLFKYYSGLNSSFTSTGGFAAGSFGGGGGFGGGSSGGGGAGR